MSATYAEAVALARRGIPVFPCRPNKAPYNAHGRNQATCDLRTVDYWWHLHPGAGVGVPTGAESGWLLIDPDLYKPGAQEAWDKLVARLGPLPPTLEARTPRGGRHLVFEYPGDEFRPYRPTIGPPADGIDVKSAGGYMLVAPSRTEHGAYEWLSNLEPAQLPPPWLAAVRRQDRPSPHRRPTPRPMAPGEGRIGDEFNQLARWEEILEPHGWTRLRSVGENQRWCRPGKSSEVSATINDHGAGVLYVFSTSAAPLEADRAYSKFAAFALLRHNGDFSAAARTLRAWRKGAA